MHMRNAICLSILAAFVAALGYGLRQLSHAMDFSSFMLFGVVTIAVMVGLGFAWDRHVARRSQQ
ncbi:hypothetical protein SAMN05443247_07627 [Bradyrhizobium erythrophlei]|nr:hypothetical protein SAMN05443247_07627 [Bradyrhizobium erythrophlei]